MGTGLTVDVHTLKNSCHLLPEEVLSGWSSRRASTAQAARARGSGAATCPQCIAWVDARHCAGSSELHAATSGNCSVHANQFCPCDTSSAPPPPLSKLPIPLGLMIRSCG